jgi:hypothetical protein
MRFALVVVGSVPANASEKKKRKGRERRKHKRRKQYVSACTRMAYLLLFRKSVVCLYGGDPSSLQDMKSSRIHAIAIFVGAAVRGEGKLQEDGER